MDTATGQAMTEHYIRPDVRAFLGVMAANPRPSFNDELIAKIRQLPPGSMPSPDLPVGEMAVLRDLTMPGPNGNLALRLFGVRAKRDPGPVVVFYHGGGFVVGSIDTHAALAAEISRSLDLPLISVEYRLAPEHPWPSAPDDAEAAARWIAQNSAVFERQFTGLILCGDSAGGNLAIVTALALRNRTAALPAIMQFLIYPGTHTGSDYPSRKAMIDGFGLTPNDMRYYDRAYASDPTHWRSSPLLADQAGLPPTLVVTASLDPLRDEGRAYAAKAIAAGVQTTFREMKGTIHGFASYRGAIASARTDLAAILKVARGMLSEL